MKIYRLNVGILAKMMVVSIWMTVTLISCKNKGEVVDETTILPSKTPKDGVFEKRGENSFVYTKYQPLANKPVTVFYYIPKEGDIKDMPVLFSFHGAERDGTIQLNAWKYFAEKYGFIVIAPQFSKDYYSENEYQFGGVFTSSSFTTVNAKEKWTYQIVEALFDYFKTETESPMTAYNMFGHSAGAQFVHRFLIAMPSARVNRAVAANAGSWTFPYLEGIIGTDHKAYGWPYSIMNAPFSNQTSITSFFNKRLWIQLGQLDTDPNDSSLPKDAPSEAQGPYRLERGRYFYQECKRLAESGGLNFSIQKAEVADANHSTLRMVYGKTVSDPTKVTNTGANGAFDLLFK